MNTHTLRPSQNIKRVYLYRWPVDFRKSYRGLSVLIEAEIGHNPFSGDLYLFINRHGSRIKAVFWERNGFVLYYKALDKDKFHWPSFDEELKVIDGQTVNWLLDGLNIDAMKPHKTLQFEALA